MKNIGIDENNQNNIFKLLSGILHLGNINFGEDDAEGNVGQIEEDSSLFALKTAAEVFGVDSESLITALTKRTMYV